MFKSAPQASDYLLIGKLQRINKYVFSAILGISILSSLTSTNVINIGGLISDVKDILYMGLMLAFSIIVFSIDFFLLPSAQKKTRCDFFDNSFGTKFVHNKNSEEYYTNDAIMHGVYKMAVNLFESSYFTYSISAKMKLKRVGITSMLVSLLIPLAYYGFKNTAFIGIVLLQTLLSIYFIGGIIRFFVFYNRNRELFEELKNLFSNKDLKESIDNYTPQIVRLYTDYESNKAWSYIHLDSKYYSEMNKGLTNKWDGIKKKYNIL